MADEVRAAWQLYKDGSIRGIYFRRDLIGVAIMIAFLRGAQRVEPFTRKI